MTAFSGWFRARSGSTWREVCCAPDYATARAKRLTFLADSSGGDATVLPRGQHPDERPSAALRYRRGRDLVLVDLLPAKEPE